MKVKIELVEDPVIIESITDGLPVDKKRRMIDYIGRSSTVWLGLADDKVACVWGVVLPTLMSNKVYLWLWTSDIVKEHPFVFVRRAQIAVKELLEDYDVVTGVVDTSVPNFASSMRWLRLIGAKFGRPTESGLIPFQIRKV